MITEEEIKNLNPEIQKIYNRFKIVYDGASENDKLKISQFMTVEFFTEMYDDEAKWATERKQWLEKNRPQAIDEIANMENLLNDSNIIMTDEQKSFIKQSIESHKAFYAIQ
jgi:hypothetical protein